MKLFKLMRCDVMDCDVTTQLRSHGGVMQDAAGAGEREAGACACVSCLNCDFPI